MRASHAKQIALKLAWVSYRILLDHVVPIASGVVIQTSSKAIISKVSPASKSLVASKLIKRSPDGAILAGSSAHAWAKYAIPKGLPQSGERTLAIENPPHLVDDFSGVIGAGYGKGTKTLLLSDNVIVKVEGKSSIAKVNYHVHEAERAGRHFDFVVEGVPPGTKQFEVNIPRGSFKGRYAFISTKGNNFVVTTMKDEGVLIPKPQYTLREQDVLSKIDPSTNIIERKIDGSLGNAHVGKNRVTFRSHREGGETYYDRLPTLEFFKNTSPFLTYRLVYRGPQLAGTVLQGELVHPDGAARVSGILNSLPANAQAIQRLRGPVTFHVWNITKLNGKDVSQLPYSERRALYEKAVREIRTVNKHWFVIEERGKDETPLQFYNRVIKAPLPYGEGVVVKPSNLALPKWDKVKLTGIHYYKLVDILPGEGKYAGTVGRMVVENPVNGARGEVGSLSVTDQLRSWIWAHKDDVIGETVKVRAQDQSSRGVPRAGVFLGFHDSDIDLLMQSESMAGGDPKETNRIMYSMKSAAGWRKK